MDMKRTLICAALAALMSGTAAAGTYEWTSGWGMGVSEHLVDDGNGNELNISCPDYEEQGYVSAYATINGKQYSSNDEPGFDVIVDGVSYSNPFYTGCRVCSEIFRGEFWEALRQANRLQLSAGGSTINLPTKNIGQVLKPLDSSENSCRPEW